MYLRMSHALCTIKTSNFTVQLCAERSSQLGSSSGGGTAAVGFKAATTTSEILHSIAAIERSETRTQSHTQRMKSVWGSSGSTYLCAGLCRPQKTFPPLPKFQFQHQDKPSRCAWMGCVAINHLLIHRIWCASHGAMIPGCAVLQTTD